MRQSIWWLYSFWFEAAVSFCHTLYLYTVWQGWRESTEGDTVSLHLLARPRCSRVRWSNPQLPQSNEGTDEALQETHTGSLQVSLGWKWFAEWVLVSFGCWRTDVRGPLSLHAVLVWGGQAHWLLLTWFWSRLLKRVWWIFPLLSPRWGGSAWRWSKPQ